MKKNMKKYEGYTKKYEGIMKDRPYMKKYMGNIKIRTLPIYGRDLEKFQAHPLISGGGWFAIRGTPEKRHETCQ